MKCPICSAKISDTDAFCPNCGSAVKSETSGYMDSIDTSKIPNDCDEIPVDKEFESCMADIPDDVERILDIVDIVEKHIKSRAKAFNEAVFNTLKKKAPYLVKIDDDVVFNKVIDSTIRYKNSRPLNDLYSLYRRLSDKDIRKFCYTEIHSMYV